MALLGRLARSVASLEREALGAARQLSGIAFQKVDRVAWDTGVSAEQQQNDIIARKAPVIVTGAIERWPIRQWTIDTLRDSYADHVVPLEVSKRGADYRDMFLSEPTATQGANFEPDVEVSLSTLLDHLQDKQRSRQDYKLYLAQKGVAEVLPGLEQQIGPAPFPVAEQRLTKSSIWLGPQGISTPLHNDPYSNIYCQVWGQKQIWLIDPSQTDSVRPFKTPLVLRNTSTTDVGDLASSGGVTTWQCNLQEGEVLYIPPKWWHQVQALSNSLSFSYWWT